jgi:hypothetical protein
LKNDPNAKGVRQRSRPATEEPEFHSPSLRTNGISPETELRSAPNNADVRLLVSAKQTGLHVDRSLALWNKELKILFQVRLETSPQLLQGAVEFTSLYTKHRFPARMAERVALASHELIENAITYGSVSADVVYTLGVVEDHIEIRVTNSSSLARLKNLRTHLERLRIDPEKVFREEMARSISGTGARAALGLARISYECQMDIGFEAEGSQVTLRAWCWR